MKVLFQTLLTFLLLSMILFTGCSNTVPSYTYALPIDGLHLGITFDELKKVLDLNDIEIVESEAGYLYHVIVHNQVVLNEYASVTYSFFNYEKGHLKDRLYSVFFEFNDIDGQQFLHELENMYGNYKAYLNTNSNLYVWEKESLSSFSIDLINDMKALEITSYTDLSPLQLEYVNRAYQDANNTSTIRIRLITPSNNMGDEKKYTLYIEGKYGVLAESVSD